MSRTPLAELEAQPEPEPKEQDEREARKYARFLVSPEALLSMGRGRFEVVDNPLPEDARIIGAAFDHTRALFVVYVESEHFKGVPEGDLLPETPAPLIRRLSE